MIDDLNPLVRIIRQNNVDARGSSIVHRRHRDPTKPAAAWTTTSRLGYDIGTALSIVLTTTGCAYARSEFGGCTMCSYLLDGTGGSVSASDIVTQFRKAMEKISGTKPPLSVKIYTSGSFLDSDEVPVEARKEIFALIASDNRIHQVVLESRPEYVSDDVLCEIQEFLGNIDVEIGIGLESSNDSVRLICINKGFTLEEFKDAVNRARRHGIGTRAYVLLKPPFLTERDALLDAIDTMISAAYLGVTTISVNPVDIQRYTLVERLWTAGQYRPPWLWTVAQALYQARREIAANVVILCDPVAAGKRRGTHNCGACDKRVIDAIRRFSLSQDFHDLEGISCDCQGEWYHALRHEDVSTIIHERPSLR